jgi:hypothetical protein
MKHLLTEISMLMAAKLYIFSEIANGMLLIHCMLGIEIMEQKNK